MNCKIVTWEEISDLTKIAVENLWQSNYCPETVVGLTRGGWVVARMCCDLLGIKDLQGLKVEHWGITATPDKTARIVGTQDVNVKNKKVLVVDDITDTGDSMKLAIEYISKQSPAALKTLTAHHIKGSKFTPDYYGNEIDWCWMVYPWNYYEDMSNLITRILTSPSRLQEIKEKMISEYNLNLNRTTLIEILVDLQRRGTVRYLPTENLWALK